MRTAAVYGRRRARNSLGTAPAPPCSTSPVDLTQVSLTGGEARVTWKAAGAAGANLLYLVLSSDDGGKSWVTQAFEQKEATADVNVNPKGKEHWVKIIATDGTRSSQAVIRFAVSAP